jgi:TPR repeat protein
MRFIAGCAVLLLLSFVPAARADEAKLVAALELFDAAALWSDGGSPRAGYEVAIGGIIRWNRPVRVFVGPSTTSSLRGIAERSVRQMAEFSGMDVEFLDSADGANLKFNFIQEYQVPANMPQSGCVTQSRWQGWAFTEVTIHVKITQPNCLPHEVMHAFGFRGHPHALDTILSYTRRGGTANGYTELDRLIVRALYRGSVTPGMYHLPALVAARKYLAEELGLAVPGVDVNSLGRAFLDKAVEHLRAEAAQKANPYIQMQLGNAYAFGVHVTLDHAEAVKYWQLAAAQKNAEAIYRLAGAQSTGLGTAPDPVAARAGLRSASDLGHGQASLGLASALRDGLGGDADPVEAFAYFDLAARRNVGTAASARDSLGGQLSEEQRARALARAQALPTTPPR